MRVFDLLKTNVEKLEEKKDIEGLIFTLKSDNEQIRQESARALGKLGSKKATKHLIQTLNDPDMNVREEAIIALGEIRDIKSVPALINAINSPYVTIRWRAAQALGKINSTKVIEPLIQTLNDPDMNVKEEAINALGRITINPLLKDLESNDAGVKEKGIITLNHVLDHLNSANFAENIFSEFESSEDEKTEEVVEEVEEPAENTKSVSDTDFKVRRELLMEQGFYTLIKNFVRKARYDYFEDFIKKTNYDYQFSDLQKLKELFEFKGISFHDDEILWLIQEEIKEQDYQDFEKKILKTEPSNLKEYLESYIENYPQTIMENQDKLQKLLQKHKISTQNPNEQLQQILKEKELEKFENKLLQPPPQNAIKKVSPNILMKFVKKELREKRDTLISTEKYHYIKNFVANSKYNYQFSDIQKLKKLLINKRIYLQEHEILWLIQEEIKEQDYQDFEKKILKTKPSNLKEYLESYIENYPQNMRENQDKLQKLLQKHKISTENPNEQLQQILKEKELEKFEKKILSPNSSESIPIKFKVTENEALNDSRILYNLGNLFYDLGKTDAALEYYNKSISKYPEFIDSWRNKGLLYYTLGRPQKAAACYNHILTLNPNYTEVWLNIGIILYEMGKLREARLCYDKALELNHADKKDLGSNIRQFLDRDPFYLDIFENFMDLIPSHELEEASSSLSPVSQILHMISMSKD